MAFSQNIWCVPKHFWNVIWAAQKNREAGRLQPSACFSKVLISSRTHCFKFNSKCDIVYLHTIFLPTFVKIIWISVHCVAEASTKQHPKIWFEKSSLAFSCNGAAPIILYFYITRSLQVLDIWVLWIHRLNCWIHLVHLQTTGKLRTTHP